MVFTIKHTFKKVTETTIHDTYSPIVHQGATGWQLAARVEQTDLGESFCIVLFGIPQCQVQSDTLYEIKAKFRFVITSHHVGKTDFIYEEEGKFYKEEVGDTKDEGVELYKHSLEEIKNKDFYLLNNDRMSVSVEIDILSLEGIDALPLYDFAKEFEGSDMVVTVNKKKFNVHSQILALNSEFFKRLIDVGTTEVKAKRPKKAATGKMEFSLDLKEEFSDDLIRTYFRLFYNNKKNLINDSNVRNLLKLTNTWTSKTILTYVEEYFMSNFEKTRIPIEEIVVMSWKFELTTLKLIVLKKMTSIDIFRKISNLEDYKTLKEGSKSDLTEQILFNQIDKK